MQRLSVLLLAALVCLGQAQKTPRTPDGKPDLSGFWQGPLMRDFFKSTGGPPFTPEGKGRL